jgi:hypothetical protein
MMPKSQLLAVLALALTLAGCGGGDKETAKGTAGGEILAGSVSDAMLPLDTVRSQPPLAPKSETSSGAKAAARPGARTEATEPGEAAAPIEADPPPATGPVVEE